MLSHSTCPLRSVLGAQTGLSGRTFRAGLLVTLCLILLAGCDGGNQIPDLVEIPAPNLASFEEAVRQQLETDARALEERLEAGKATASELATAFGELGRRYHVY